MGDTVTPGTWKNWRGRGRGNLSAGYKGVICLTPRPLASLSAPLSLEGMKVSLQFAFVAIVRLEESKLNSKEK